MAKLSTHVLDISSGDPARGVQIELHAVRGSERQHMITIATNADGRIDSIPIEPGVYEFIFHAGDYFRSQGKRVGPTPFLDQIVVRFGVGDASRNYHVPLLLGPFGYSTYRGS